MLFNDVASVQFQDTRIEYESLMYLSGGWEGTRRRNCVKVLQEIPMER
jgi:hypothetical protein